MREIVHVKWEGLVLVKTVVNIVVIPEIWYHQVGITPLNQVLEVVPVEAVEEDIPPHPFGTFHLNHHLHHLHHLHPVHNLQYGVVIRGPLCQVVTAVIIDVDQNVAHHPQCPQCHPDHQLCQLDLPLFHPHRHHLNLNQDVETFVDHNVMCALHAQWEQL